MWSLNLTIGEPPYFLAKKPLGDDVNTREQLGESPLGKLS
jgi:hypothetical protein